MTDDEEPLLPGMSGFRSEKEEKLLMNRLNRTIGQLEGVRRMLESGASCTELLMLVSAVQASLRSFSKEVLLHYLTSDVAEELRHGDSASLDELASILKKIL
ncbi:MAG: metal-sensing transcriptional repressor [Treponema sp.]|nr:metal-sensing transcriptional repressor [Treponema sp.]